MRNRILARHGANADVSMVGATNDLDGRRETLRERGLLSDGLDLLNIYEHYRDTDWPGEEPSHTSHLTSPRTSPARPRFQTVHHGGVHTGQQRPRDLRLPSAGRLDLHPDAELFLQGTHHLAERHQQDLA